MTKELSTFDVVSSFHVDFKANKLMAYRNSWTLEARVGRWTLDSGRWTLDAGLWTLDAGLRTLSLTVAEQNQNPVSDFA